MSRIVPTKHAPDPRNEGVSGVSHACRGDRYLCLADLTSYVKTQKQLGVLYQQTDPWTTRAILNAGRSGRFSSDRTISEYASVVWHVGRAPGSSIRAIVSGSPYPYVTGRG